MLRRKVQKSTGNASSPASASALAPSASLSSSSAAASSARLSAANGTASGDIPVAVRTRRTLSNTEANDDEHTLAQTVFGNLINTRGSEGSTMNGKTEMHVSQVTRGGKVAKVADPESDSEVDGDSDSEIESKEQKEDSGSDSESDNENSIQSRSSVAWKDTDDAQVRVSLKGESRLKKLRNTEEEDQVEGNEFSRRLRGQFEKVHRAPKWASKEHNTNKDSYGDTESEEDEDDDGVSLALRSTASLVSKPSSGMNKQGKVTHLPARAIETLRVRDANRAEYSSAIVQSVQFHPYANVLLTAGFDKTLRLFQVDGKDNSKIQSVHIPNFPIYNALFSPDGKQVYASSRRPFFYCYDIEGGQVDRIPGVRGRSEKSFESFELSPDGKYICFLGKDGYIILVSTRTKQWVADLKMNGDVRSIAFSSTGDRLYSYGSDGSVYIWDMNTRDCIHRFNDQGCIHGIKILTSPNDAYLACGSDTGIVNIYDGRTILQSSTPKPIKAVENLVTAVSYLSFNHDSQILAAGSSKKRDALKLIHLPSATVFANWPSANTPLHYVSSFKFSPQSGYFAIGNDKGKVLLYRLKHYNQY